MFKPFRTAAVLGAGVMGSQIAAHLANAGLSVHLLNIAESKDNPNAAVEAAFKHALKLSPPIFFTEKTARRVTLGNFDEHFDRLNTVDWVIEAVVEDLAIKQALMARVEATIRPDTIVTTNTSGLSIQAIVEGRSLSFRQRFLGSHFFNPPRYLKLLELIPTPGTDPLVLERLQWFGRLHLGKGIIIAKDTPNFIANRIGLYATMQGVNGLTSGYSIEEIDTLTGTLVGRPKSATFRTADLVGLDTLVAVTKHLYDAVPEDENRDMFQVPELLAQLVAKRALGAKTGQGFYQKQNHQILSVNPQTFAYEVAQPLNLETIDRIAKIPDLGERLRLLYADLGRGGQFFRDTTLSLLGYCARRIPEIVEDPAEIDRALRWGFGWELGPFEIWDHLGFERVLTDMEAQHLPIPSWVAKMRYEGATGFYQTSTPVSPVMPPTEPELCRGTACYTTGVVHSHQGPILLTTPTDEISLKEIKADPKHTLWQNSESALLDLGEGVALFEFRSKGNTLSLKVLEGLDEVLSLVEKGEFRGLVIGNDSAHFCGGANLAEMGMMAQSGNRAGIAHLIDHFQALLQRIHYAPHPIVAAIQGRVLGGGTELVMACPHVVAAAETYIGLVELSVGLIPGAGGIMRMVSRAVQRSASESVGHIQPFLQRAFETIAMAKVSNSAQEGQDWGYLPANAQIIMNGDRRLFVAKQEVLRLAYEGYTPPPENNSIMVLGRPARAMLEHIAYVITGGELSAPTLVPESYLLQLERDNFLPLLSQPKTQERIAHLLKTKKPLRN
jgi:3-hydroxyacyl-CoA dehydrogenase